METDYKDNADMMIPIINIYDENGILVNDEFINNLFNDSVDITETIPAIKLEIQRIYGYIAT